jgi:hypothetical protein
MSNDQTDFFVFNALPGFSWFCIDIPLLQKTKFRDLLNLFEQAFFFTQVIDDENCSFRSVVFGQNNLSARLLDLDVLADNTILTMFMITTPDEYNWELKTLLIASMFHIEPFLLWKKEIRQISLIQVTRMIFNEIPLQPNNFED